MSNQENSLVHLRLGPPKSQEFGVSLYHAHEAMGLDTPA